MLRWVSLSSKRGVLGIIRNRTLIRRSFADSSSNDIDVLLANNKAWANRIKEKDPTFFLRRATGQEPKYLFIGCSDSRVPAEELLGCKPGELFVTRNVANLVCATDMNMLSVLQFSIEILKVKHIIVCGHYGCGGVKSAMTPQRLGLIDNWTRAIRDVARLHSDEIYALPDIEDELGESERHKRVVELNVVEQCYNLYKNGIVQQSLAETGFPRIHGLVYSLRDGLVTEVPVDYKTVNKFSHIYKLFK